MSKVGMESDSSLIRLSRTALSGTGIKQGGPAGHKDASARP